MRNKRFSAAVLGATCALLFAAAPVSHAAIIKLTLGETGPDVGMNPLGIFSTLNDGIAGTTGDQNTAVEYTGFLNFIPDIVNETASFSLGGIQAVGPANVFGSVVIQNFAGGTLNLYDPANNLLLAGSLNTSALTGVIGTPGTGSVFSTTLATVTGGTLAPFIAPGSLSFSLEMTNVNGGAGFSVAAGAAPILAPFEADATLSIEGDFIPEPGSMALLSVAATASLARRRRR